MPSFAPVYMYRRRGISRKAGSLRQRAGAAIAGRVRDAMVQAGRGRPLARPGQASRTTMPVASATRTATAVATQMTTRRRPSKKTKEYKPRPRLVNAVASTILKSSIKTIPQIYQRMNELSTGYGANPLSHSTLASGGYVPLHAYCLTTLDRPNADKGDVYPFHFMKQDSSFDKLQSNGVVFGNASGIAAQQTELLASASKMFLSSVKVRMLFWGRIHRETTYQVQVIRFKKPLYHINPFTAPDEELSLSLLTAEQLAERKAFWLDFQLRKHTVNPVAVSQNLSSRFSKYVEVLYDKSITIQEQESSFDEQNNELVTMTLPVNRFMQFNHDVDTRYSSYTDAQRTDEVLNTDTTDLADVNHYHKAAVNHNLWLIIRANNAITAGTGGEDTEQSHISAPYVPTYDISFQCNYKVLDAQ